MRILSRDPDIDPSAPPQTAEFAVISGFAVRITSFPVYDRVSKNTRRFRALSAFEKSPLTSTHIRRPFLPPLRLLTQGFKLVRNSTRARWSALFVAPQAIAELLTFDPSKQYGLLELPLLRCFCRSTPSKTPSDGIFVEIFSSQSPLATMPACTLRRIMRMREIRRAAILREIFCRPPPDFALSHYARAYYAIPTRRRQRFLSFFRILSRAYMRARSRSYV